MRTILFLSLICWSCQGDADKEALELFDISEHLVISSELCPPGDQKIPKIFHQIWLDFGKGTEIPAHYQNYTNRLLELHPN